MLYCKAVRPRSHGCMAYTWVRVIFCLHGMHCRGSPILVTWDTVAEWTLDSLADAGVCPQMQTVCTQMEVEILTSLPLLLAFLISWDSIITLYASSESLPFHLPPRFFLCSCQGRSRGEFYRVSLE